MVRLKYILFIGLIIVGCTKQESNENLLTMLVTTNVRGQLDPCGWKANPLGGLPRRFSYINQVKDSGIDPILLDAGDALFENYYIIKEKLQSAKLKAKTVLESTANMGDYYYNVGHYDFAAGYKYIKELENLYRTRFISSNLFIKGTDERAFLDHQIVKRNGLAIGIFGIINKIPESVKEQIDLKEPIIIAKNKINELRPQVDILIMLLNASKPQDYEAMPEFENVDYIFSSRETIRTRPERTQEEGKPLKYCMGIQGKYIGRVDLAFTDKSKPITDVTSRMMTVNLFQERLNSLQKKEPGKPLEEIYKNNRGVLDMVKKFQSGVSESKSGMEGASNKSYYTLIPLGGNVKSEKKTLDVVDRVLKTCEELDRQNSVKT